MRHLQKGRRLNRKPAHLLALKRNLAMRLIAHERIVTTVAKAKELRSYVEKLITAAKKAALALESAGQAGDQNEAKKLRLRAVHLRRRIIAELGGKKTVVIVKGNERETIRIVAKLIGELGLRYRTRLGGYTRVVKRAERRLGDAAPTAYIELMGPLEDKAKEIAAKSPRPNVES